MTPSHALEGEAYELSNACNDSVAVTPRSSDLDMSEMLLDILRWMACRSTEVELSSTTSKKG